MNFTPKCGMILTTGAGNNLSKAVIQATPLEEWRLVMHCLGFAWASSHRHCHPKFAF